jgi:hypothetical protein
MIGGILATAGGLVFPGEGKVALKARIEPVNGQPASASRRDGQRRGRGTNFRVRAMCFSRYSGSAQSFCICNAFLASHLGSAASFRTALLSFSSLEEQLAVKGITP